MQEETPESPSFPKKAWAYVKNLVKVQEDDHWIIKALKWGLLALFVCVAILLSPFIILILAFSFMITL